MVADPSGSEETLIKLDKCKGCGAAIVWAKTSAGANIPLDAIAPVYEMGRGIAQDTCERAERDFLVSHFSTCPKAGEFSGRSKSKA